MKRFMMCATAIAFLGLAMLAVGCDGDDGSDGEGDGNGNGGGGATPAPSEVQLTEADSGTTVTLAKDGTLIVALASNPSTGFSWAIVSPEPEFLELDGEPKFVPAGSTTQVPGAAGTQVFTLRATGAGSSVLNMEYNRTESPPGDPEQSFKVTVETK